MTKAGPDRRGAAPTVGCLITILKWYVITSLRPLFPLLITLTHRPITEEKKDDKRVGVRHKL